MADAKHTFSFESQINKQKNVFDLALDFPIIGETKVSLSLNPKEVSKEIGRSNIVQVLREQILDRPDREEIIKTVEEFFVFASDFVRFKGLSIYPNHFTSSYVNDHFILGRETPHYIFQVENFSENEIFYERSVFKIFLKSSSKTTPIMTLFLVPRTCDKQ